MHTKKIAEKNHKTDWVGIGLSLAIYTAMLTLPTVCFFQKATKTEVAQPIQQPTETFTQQELQRLPIRNFFRFYQKTVVEARPNNKPVIVKDTETLTTPSITAQAPIAPVTKTNEEIKPNNKETTTTVIDTAGLEQDPLNGYVPIPLFKLPIPQFTHADLIHTNSNNEATYAVYLTIETNGTISKIDFQEQGNPVLEAQLPIIFKHWQVLPPPQQIIIRHDYTFR